MLHPEWSSTRLSSCSSRKKRSRLASSIWYFEVRCPHSIRRHFAIMMIFLLREDGRRSRHFKREQPGHPPLSSMVVATRQDSAVFQRLQMQAAGVRVARALSATTAHRPFPGRCHVFCPCARNRSDDPGSKVQIQLTCERTICGGPQASAYTHAVGDLHAIC